MLKEIMNGFVLVKPPHKNIVTSTFLLTSFHAIEVCTPVGGFAVAYLFHVAGIFVWSCV